MYKIDRVVINGFWGRRKTEVTFNHDVNIIIGRNGTGKTTFMNILESILTVDLVRIATHEFTSVEIYLSNDGKKKTIKATKGEGKSFPYAVIEYKISNKKYPIKIINLEERGVFGSMRRRVIEESENLKKILSEIVSVSSISVYRLRSSDSFEVNDRHGTKSTSPVDYRLDELMASLTHYQLYLSQQARVVATNLQKDVLASILYSEEDAQDSEYGLEFNKEEEVFKLASAYKQLKVFDSNINRKINFHVSSINNTLEDIKLLASKAKEIKAGASEENHKAIDFRPLEALRKSRKIVDLSLEAENKTKEIYSQINLFIDILKGFIKDKDFDFDSGSLVIKNKHNGIAHERLSSGEKQLLILLIEALLQKQKPHIFLADEPELSLHIEWQQKVIPAVVKLNPKAQVVVATHSPEVACEYSSSIFDMEDMIHE